MPERSSQKANSVAANAAVPARRGRFIRILVLCCLQPRRMPDSRRRVDNRKRFGTSKVRFAYLNLSQSVMRGSRSVRAPALLALGLSGLRRARLVLAIHLLLVDPPAPQADERHDERQRQQEVILAIQGGEPLRPCIQVQECVQHDWCTIAAGKESA